MHFINRDGERLTATAKEGQSLLEVVVNQNLAIDGFGKCCTSVCAPRIDVSALTSGYLGTVQLYTYHCVLVRQ